MSIGTAGIVHRPARAQDFFSVFAIYMHGTIVPYLGFDPMPPDLFASVYNELLDGGGFHVVELGGEVAGFYRVRRQTGRAAHVAHVGPFAVAPDHHGRGIGRSILEQLTLRLQSEGVTRIELTVEADNARAIALYERLGFVHEGRLRAAYKRSHEAHYTDELLMAKLLEAAAPD